MSEMFTQFVHAKPSAHSLAIALIVLSAFAHHFFSDPNAAAWLASHWAVRDLLTTCQYVLPVLAVYFPSLKKAA